MEITTAFDIGQEVWHVFSRIQREVEKCSLCEGAGQVKLVGVKKYVKCPKCWGHGERESGEQYQQHVVSHTSLTIGQVRVEVEGPTGGDSYRNRGYAVDHSNMGPRSQKRDERYMATQTGVGSGTLYWAKDLFATREEAEAEALSRTTASIESVNRYDEVAVA